MLIIPCLNTKLNFELLSPDTGDAKRDARIAVFGKEIFFWFMFIIINVPYFGITLLYTIRFFMSINN